MSRYIDADEYVTVWLYDDEREEEYTERMTIAESLDHFTDEGCPQTIDAVEVVHGKWKRKMVDNGFNIDWVCSKCGYRVMTDFVSYSYCPNCGAKMKGTDDE